MTPTPSVTPTPAPVVTQIDLTIEPKLPPDLKPDGVLVVVSQKNQYAGYLLDFPSTRKQLLSAGTVFIPAGAALTISPDWKRLAYIELTNTLHIVIADGQQQLVRRWPDDQLLEIIGWLDNQRLVMAEFNNDDGTVIVFDPLTQESQKVTPAFPAVSSHGKIVGFDGTGIPGPIYDPTLTRVVINRYLAHLKYELWDVQSKKILWERFPGLFQSRPIWSPDGTRFAVLYDSFNGSRDGTYGALYVVDRDGQETRLTDFVAGNMAWSPDGRFIATWWRHPHPLYSEDLQPLTIVDETGRENAVYVFSNGFTTSDEYPIWSPDGQWVAFNGYIGTSPPDEGEGAPNSVILLNIAQRRAFEVARNVLVRGWMAATP